LVRHYQWGGKEVRKRNKMDLEMMLFLLDLELLAQQVQVLLQQMQN
jgi:hypothetical protein